MTDSIEQQPPDPPQPAIPIRLQPIILLAGAVGGLLIAVALWMILSARSRVEQGESWAFRRFGLANAVPNRLASRFVDQDQDLLADPPSVEATTTPEVLLFSYIPDHREIDPAAAWDEFMQRLAQAVGLPVAYRKFDSVSDQLRALEQGELHVTALNTGSVPRAVNRCGFIPVSVQASADGDWQITMKLIVPADSPVRSVRDLKREFITFTNPDSFSGFKYGIVVLLLEFGMQPGRDYDYRFSTSHEQSIEGIANKQLEAALVASDLLEAAYSNRRIDREQIREIYTSPPFPAAAFGYTYNLSPSLAEKVRQFLTDCDLSGTPIGNGQNDASSRKLIATNYRVDWESVRKVDDSIREGSKPEPTRQAAPAETTEATVMPQNRSQN
jgi:phosphonate transport system substrate-binding protein